MDVEPTEDLGGLDDVMICAGRGCLALVGKGGVAERNEEGWLTSRRKSAQGSSILNNPEAVSPDVWAPCNSL
jgi:hypothetical protein